MKAAPSSFASIASLALTAPALAAAALAGGGEASDPGERAFMQCYSCHSLEGGDRLEGPSLQGIIGSRVAARPVIAYSPAMKRFAAANPVWTSELLDRFIADPEALVPGTSMAYPGMGDAADRRALIAWLERQPQPTR